MNIHAASASQLDAFPTLSLMIADASPSDQNRGIARLDLADLTRLNASIGDIIQISGTTSAYARAMPIADAFRGKGCVMIDVDTQKNAGLQIGETARLCKCDIEAAQKLTLTALQSNSSIKPTHIAALAENRPVAVGNIISVQLDNGQRASFIVDSLEPEGPCLIVKQTGITLSKSNSAGKAAGDDAYSDLGGLSREVERMREVVELPIKHPELFERLGIQPPRGVLLSGPPGTGKTLLARAVARECKASFFQINGPEIVSKHYGESEKHLRDIFRKAESEQPAIIFIDEIDAIAPKREALNGDRQVERRIVGQLLTLLDGLTSRGQVIVMAATNLPNSIDPALRRPGRFDREIAFNVPDKHARREILLVHTCKMPLHSDFDLDHIAGITHGYVGADLAALSREAGMAALRRITDAGTPIADQMRGDISVRQCDFIEAHREIIPSAIREVFTDVPDTSWSDVGGHDDIKQALVEAVVWPLRYPDLFEKAGVRPSKGIILSGLPGTGKTLLAKTLASESGVSFISVRGPQLLSQFVGESERAVRDVFQKARMAAPSILFFDEIDALAPRRGGEAGAVLDRVVAQFLTEIDGIEDLRGVFVLAATNRPDNVDPAVMRPGRFDLILEVGLPDEATRLRILQIHSAKVELAADVDLGSIAVRIGGMSGADIEGMCKQAALGAIRRAVAAAKDGVPGAVIVTAADFTAAALAMQSSTKSKRTDAK